MLTVSVGIQVESGHGGTRDGAVAPSVGTPICAIGGGRWDG